MKRASFFAALFFIAGVSLSSCQRDRCPSYGQMEDQQPAVEAQAETDEPSQNG